MPNFTQSLAGIMKGLGKTSQYWLPLAMTGGNPVGMAQVGAQAVQGLTEGRRNAKNERRYGKAQAQANLVNFLSPGTNTQPAFKPKSPGLLETLSGLTAQGLQGYQTMKDLGQTRKLRDLQITGAEKDLLKADVDLAADKINQAKSQLELDEMQRITSPDYRLRQTVEGLAAAGGNPTQIPGVSLGRATESGGYGIDPEMQLSMGRGGQTAKDTALNRDLTQSQIWANLGQASRAARGDLKTPDVTKLDPETIAEGIGASLFKNPYDTFPADEAFELIAGGFPGVPGESIGGKHRAMLALAQDGYQKRAKDVQEYLAETAKDLLKDGRNRSPDLLIGEFQETAQKLGVTLPLSEYQSFVDKAHATSGLLPLGVGEQAKLGEILQLQDAINSALLTLNDPTKQEELSSTFGYFSAKKELFSQWAAGTRALDEQSVAMLSKLGFIREVALRKGPMGTGAAALDSEYARFRDVFVGSIDTGIDNLKTQLQTLHDQYEFSKQGIYKAAAASKGSQFGPGGPTSISPRVSGIRSMLENLR